MPEFKKTSIDEAKRLTGGTKRDKALAVYANHIKQLVVGEAGKAVPSAEETLSTVRRRVGDAGRMLGVEMEIRRTQDSVYFWLKEKRKRGRPRTRNI